MVNTMGGSCWMSNIWEMTVEDKKLNILFAVQITTEFGFEFYL